VSEMTWEQKLHAMQILRGSGTSLLCMLAPGAWLCSVPGEVGGDGMLVSPCCQGSSPEQAVEAAWREATELPAGKHLVVSLAGARRNYRWSGFMWVEVSK
jgi:hypothetical protein